METCRLVYFLIGSRAKLSMLFTALIIVAHSCAPSPALLPMSARLTDVLNIMYRVVNVGSFYCCVAEK